MGLEQIIFKNKILSYFLLKKKISWGHVIHAP